MKLLMLSLLAASFTLTVSGQNKNIFKNKPWVELKQKRLLQDTLNRIYSIPRLDPNNAPGKITPPDRGVMKYELKGRYIGENGKGDEIYGMQPDNMPCIVPGKQMHLNMPVAGEKNNKDLPMLKKDREKFGEIDDSRQRNSIAE